MASKLSLCMAVLFTLSGCVNNPAYRSLDGASPSSSRSAGTAPPIQASQPETKASASSSSNRPGRYRVRRGDTLYSIAFHHGLDYKKLANANQIGTDFTIFVGQELVLRESDHGPATARPPRPVPKPAGDPLPSDTKVNSQKGDVNQLPEKIAQTVDTEWIWPHNGKIVRTFNAEVSDRKGVDIGGEIGDSVRAAARGTVVYAGNGLPGYGNLIILEHSSSLLSAYAFNQELLVSERDQVEKGQVIAKLGKQGDQPRLHFEIRREGKPVDPLGYLPGR